MPKRPAPSYQEAVVACLPMTPYLSWPLLCLAALAWVIAVVHKQFFLALDALSVKLLVLLALSYVVIVYQIVGIIVGQRRSKKLEALLPDLLGPHYQHPPLTLGQRCLPGWRTMLPWEVRLRRVWRCGPILIVAAAGGVFGLKMAYDFFATATSNQSVAIALGLWFGLAGLTGVPANYHLSAVSWFIWCLSTQADKTVFPAPTTSGMNWVARLALQYLLLYSGAAFVWMLIVFIAFGPTLTTGLVAVVMSLFIFVGFALPQLSIRATMLRRKREMLDGILTRIQSDDLVSIVTPTRYVRRLMNLYTFVSVLPPSGLFGAVATAGAVSVAASFLPLFLLALLRIAGDIFPHSTTLQVANSILR